MYWFGLSVTTMTLGGLAIAVGEVVDDAVVDVENVFRRLRENRVSAAPWPVLQVVYEASSEIRNSIVFATVVVVLAFLPLFFLSGIEGRMFSSLGVAYIVSILASLAVSLTSPPHGARTRSVVAQRFGPSDSGLVRGLKRLDLPVIQFGLRHAGPVVVGALVAFLIAVALFFAMGREFLPPFTGRDAHGQRQCAAGHRARIVECDRHGGRAGAAGAAGRGVDRPAHRAGRARRSRRGRSQHRDRRRARSVAAKPGAGAGRGAREPGLAKGVTVNVGQPISHRLDHILSGIQAQVAIKLFGPDLAQLRTSAARIEEAIRQVPGGGRRHRATDVDPPGRDPDRPGSGRAQYGLQVGPTNEFSDGAQWTRRLAGDRRDKTDRSGRASRRPLPRRHSGAARLARRHATRNEGSAVDHRTRLERNGPQPDPPGECAATDRRAVQHGGRDLGSVIADIQRVVGEAVQLPPGYFIEHAGQFESQQQATRLIGLSLISIVLIFGALYGHFRSARLALQVMASIPLAIIGGVIATFISGGTLSVAALVGFITVAGISARNSIMMLSHYLHLMAYEGEAFDEKMIVRGSLERLVPVLMTGLTTGLAMVPLAFSGGVPGSEILQPVAIVILGGL